MHAVHFPKCNSNEPSFIYLNLTPSHVQNILWLHNTNFDDDTQEKKIKNKFLSFCNIGLGELSDNHSNIDMNFINTNTTI